MEFDAQIISTIARDVFIAFYKVLFVLSNVMASLFSIVRMVNIDKEFTSPCAYKSSKKVFFWCICLGTGFAAIAGISGMIRGSGIYPISTFLVSVGANYHWMSKQINVISQITEEYNDN